MDTAGVGVCFKHEAEAHCSKLPVSWVFSEASTFSSYLSMVSSLVCTGTVVVWVVGTAIERLESL